MKYAYNCLGIPPEQSLEAPMPSPGKHVIGADFAKEERGQYGKWKGTATLHVDGEVVATGTIRTMTGHFALCGEGLCIGYDGGDAVTSDYSGKFDYTGGKIHKVVFDVADDAYVDVEMHFEAAYSRD